MPACGRSSARAAATEASGSSRASTWGGSRVSRSRSSATATRRRCSARRSRQACSRCTAPWWRTTWHAVSPSAPPRTCKPCSPTPRGAGRRRRRSRSGPARPPDVWSAAASRCWWRRSAPPGRPTPTARSSSSRTSPSGPTASTACSPSSARRARSSASRASSSAPWRRARRSTAWARSTSCARASATCPARSPSASPRGTLPAAPARRTWRSPSASRSRSTPSAGASPRSRRRSSDVDFAGVGREIERIERQGRLNFIASRGAKEWVYEQINRERPEYEVGARSVYSDLGFMLLGELIEVVSRMPLDRFCHERIFRPLGLRASAFVDLTALRTRKLTPVAEMIAPTEHCPWRQRLLCGEVHDDNAYAMGGVAGHAGLFANAAEVDALAVRLLACWRGEDDFVPREIVREFWTRNPTVRDATWALGWDTPSPTGSMAGTRMSRTAVGHLGFTGTSLWIDLERGVSVVLLTNRVHPQRDNERIREVRPRVHDAVMEALGA